MQPTPALLLRALRGDERFPYDLVLCNLADTSRRNSHLGFRVVDADIELFDRIVHRNLGPHDRAARAGGDDWLVLTNDGAAWVAAVCREYVRTDPYRSGWRCSARSNGEEKVVTETVETSISRSARFLSTSVTARLEIEMATTELHDHYVGAALGALTNLEHLCMREHWRAVASYPKEAYFCPFCKGRTFDWMAGDMSVYDAEGTCKTCGANVSFSDAGGS